jgi:hypothetical protein
MWNFTAIIFLSTQKFLLFVLFIFCDISPNNGCQLFELVQSHGKTLQDVHLQYWTTACIQDVQIVIVWKCLLGENNDWLILKCGFLADNLVYTRLHKCYSIEMWKNSHFKNLQFTSNTSFFYLKSKILHTYSVRQVTNKTYLSEQFLSCYRTSWKMLLSKPVPLYDIQWYHIGMEYTQV